MNLRRAALWPAALLLLAMTGCGGEDWPAPKPALWEVTAPDGRNGWLFGTVHALPDGVAWRTPAVDEALAQSGVLVVEIADLGEPHAQALFRDMAETPGQPPLSTRVPAADRAALAALMDRAGADDGDFARVETWGAAILLAGAVREGDPAAGVDRELIAGAHEVVGLESHAAQFAMFDRLPPTAQGELLAATAREAGKPDSAHAALEAWLSGDVDRLAGLEAGSVLADPALREALLAARNRAWAAPVADAVNQGRRPFVAVGAAHVTGADGLIALLEARGFAVRRVQ